MAAPDQRTMASRSGTGPICAKRAKLLPLGLLLVCACLNPMPEEFPSNDGPEVTVGGGVTGSVGNDANETPSLPGTSTGSEDFVGESGGSGGASAGSVPPATQPPSNGADGEAAAPDAGAADAGPPSVVEDTRAEETGDEGDTAP